MDYNGVLAANFWKKGLQEEGGTARKRTATISSATEQTLGTPTDTNATMQASSTAAEADAATEHVAAGAENHYVHASHRDGI